MGNFAIYKNTSHEHSSFPLLFLSEPTKRKFIVSFWLLALYNFSLLGCSVGSKSSNKQATSTLTNKFQIVSITEESGSRITGGSVPFIMKLDDNRFRLYYCGREGILSAISSDGLTFTQEPGVRISPDLNNPFEKVVCDPTVIKLLGGKIRMYYKGANSPQGGPGQAIHKIFSAISSDGLNYQKEGLRIDSEVSGDMGWSSVPDAVVLPDGKIRLYFVSGDPTSGGIMTMTSYDGLHFGERKALNVTGFVDPAILLLPTNTFLLITAVINEQFPPYRKKGLYLLTSKDGLYFETETLLLKGEGIFDPSGIWINNTAIRIYYGFALPPAQPEIRSIMVEFRY